MAQFPVLLNPKYLVRRKALRNGLFGPSRLWRAIAFGIIVHNSTKQAFGKHPERLGRRRVGVGHVLTVATYAPMTRRQRKSLGITKATLAADARAELEAAQRAS